MTSALLILVIRNLKNVSILLLIAMMGVSVLMIVVMKEQDNVPTLKYTVMIMMLVLTTYVCPKLVVNTPKSLVMIMMLVLMIHAILPLVVFIPQ
jgi:hypothetical protein